MLGIQFSYRDISYMKNREAEKRRKHHPVKEAIPAPHLPIGCDLDAESLLIPCGNPIGDGGAVRFRVTKVAAFLGLDLVLRSCVLWCQTRRAQLCLLAVGAGCPEYVCCPIFCRPDAFYGYNDVFFKETHFLGH